MKSGILLVLGVILFSLTATLVSAVPQGTDVVRTVLEPGEKVEYPVGGNGAFYKVEWCARAADRTVTELSVAARWLGFEYLNLTARTDNVCIWRTWWLPGSSQLVFQVFDNNEVYANPAEFVARIERREGIVIPIQVALPPGFTTTLDVVPSKTGKGATIEGRHHAIVFVKSDKNTNNPVGAHLVGNEKGSHWHITTRGTWLHAEGDKIQLKITNPTSKIIYIRGYILLEPIQDNISDATSTQGEQAQRQAPSGTSTRLLMLGMLGLLGALAGLGLTLRVTLR